MLALNGIAGTEHCLTLHMCKCFRFKLGLVGAVFQTNFIFYSLEYRSQYVKQIIHFQYSRQEVSFIAEMGDSADTSCDHLCLCRDIVCHLKIHESEPSSHQRGMCVSLNKDRNMNPQLSVKTTSCKALQNFMHTCLNFITYPNAIFTLYTHFAHKLLN